MKRFCFLLFLLPFLLGTSSSSAIKVKFHQGSLTSAKTQAAKEGKLYFVEFMASWCMPCRWMDETTFTDTRLADYIHQHYIAVKVNIDDFDGYAYKELYDVKLLPSFLIFNSKGELLDQYAESLSAGRLLSILQRYNVPANRGTLPIAAATPEQETVIEEQEASAVSSPNEPVVPSADYSITTTPTSPAAARPPGRPEATNPSQASSPEPYADEVTEAILPEEQETVVPTVEKPEVEMPGIGLYRFSVTRQKNQGYSLQTGVYEAYETVLLEAAKLEKEYQDYPVIVHIAALEGKRVYRVMLGEFPQKRDVIQFKRQLERYGVEGVIKSLAAL